MVESVVGILANYLLPYLILSVLAMLVVELLAALTNRRAKVLQQFIRGMLCDPDGTGLAGKFYGHHLIKSLAMRGSQPSYVPSHLFVIVLTDIASPNEGQPRAETADQTLVHAELATGLNAIWRNAARTNPAAALQRWFDDVMDGASGAYRRGTIAWLGVVAFAMVGFVNFDAIRLSSYVARRGMTEKAAAAIFEAAAKRDTAVTMSAVKQALASIDSDIVFPLSWKGVTVDQWPRSLLGLAISWLSIVLTAPFLFDLLSRFMIVRSTVKPYYVPPPTDAISTEAPATSAASTFE